jgi:uncharacterized protein YkwD
MLASLAPLALAAQGVAAPSNSAAWQQEILTAHNSERAEVGSPPLVWSDALARDAAAYAHELASTNTFDHDPNNDDQGENLWAGTRGAYTAREMVGSWAEEKAAAMRNRRWWAALEQTGHWVQLVWGDTRAVGCAVARNRSDDVLVCRYYPAGNIIGQSPYGGRTR